ncbi:MAG: hypothetical protein Kow00128_12990 [Deltaproteobacteria bacterium]
MRTRTGNRTRGFTLVEILMVVVMISIIAFMAVPYMQGLIDKYRVRSAAREFVGLFNRVRAAAIQAPAALGNPPYQIRIDCGADTFSVDPAIPGGGKLSFSAAQDFLGVNIYAVEGNLNNAPAGEMTGVVTRGVERTGSCALVGGTRNFTVFLSAPNNNFYRVQVYGTIGATKILAGW